jgi:hypothetical protein
MALCCNIKISIKIKIKSRGEVTNSWSYTLCHYMPPWCDNKTSCLQIKHNFILKTWKSINIWTLAFFFQYHNTCLHESRDTAVGIATGYKLDTKGSQFESRWRQEFSLLHVVQTGYGVHPTSYPMGNGGSFPWGKAAGAWNWPLTSNSNTFTPSICFHGVVFN